jgi:CDP-diglyceride synthetase
VKADRKDHQVAEGTQPQKRGSGFFRLFERGVDTATRNNVTAYGYSVSITAAFALLQTSRSDTGILEIFVFAAGAVVAFALIAAVASGFFREELEDQPSNVKSLAGALSFFFGWPCTWGCIRRWDTDTRLAAWPASTFLTTLVYIAAVGLELAVAHRILGSDE